jgi:iron(III) transport system substrate-binding protein
MNRFKLLLAALGLVTFSVGHAADDWQQTLAAAKKEGSIVVSASSSELMRKVFTSFEQDYPGIKVEYHAGNLRDFRLRVDKERDMGQFLWDVRIGGTDASTYQWKDKGVLAPIRPLMAAPDVVKDATWIGGIDSLFGDKEKKYVLHFTSYIFGGPLVDRDVISEKDFNSSKDLTDPRWKGKIVMQDPRVGGAGNASLAAYIGKYGEQFVRDLLSKQDIVISDNKRQMAEWLVRKRYPIVVGMGSDDTIAQFQQQGLGKNVKNVLIDAVADDGIILFDKAPHPNAAKVFLNWLLSQKTQTKLAETASLNSRRVDVKSGNPILALDPKRMDQYLQTLNEDNVALRVQAQQIAKEYIK